MDKVRTNWMTATTNPSEVLMGLVSCLNAGKNAWIECRPNTKDDMEYPIMKKNPELDNPFNWIMAYGIPRTALSGHATSYFNETEERLTYNYTACFGTEEAVKVYQETGRATEGLVMGGGVCHPVLIEDANQYREQFTKDNYKYNYWAYKWEPKEGIPYYVVDTSIKEAFVVCYDDDMVDKAEAAKRSAEFLTKYACTLEDNP